MVLTILLIPNVLAAGWGNQVITPPDLSKMPRPPDLSMNNIEGRILSEFVGKGVDSRNNTTLENMSYDEYMKYFHWFTTQDKTSKTHQYERWKYVCVNYTQDSIKAAIMAGFDRDKLYAAELFDYQGRGHHFVIAVHVTGLGWRFLDPEQPERGAINNDIMDDKIGKNLTIVDCDSFLGYKWNDETGYLELEFARNGEIYWDGPKDAIFIPRT
jgi:hypothetical protein